LTKTQKSNKRKRMKRKRQREFDAPHTKVKDVSKKYVERARKNVFSVDEEISSLRHTSTAWTGLPPRKGSLPKTKEMKELEEMGMKPVEWDGW
jgi:hypothetical protein